MKKAILLRPIEILEQRIAPATLMFTDVDGDGVTVTTSKGTDAALSSVAHFAASGGGQVLQLLSLTTNPVFQGTDLSILVTGNNAGHVDVGFIDATNLDLGSVTIAGDLGRISAGDTHAGTPAIKDLEIHSLAAQGTTTQAAGGSIVDDVFGAVTTMHVAGDVDGTLLITGSGSGANGKIGTLQIDGSVIGGADSQSGSIRATGNIKTINVTHDIVGAAGPDSGSIFSGGFIKTATIGGGIVGSSDAAGVRSGRLASNHGMGTVTVTGSLTGGLADSSGQIVSANMTSITIGQSIIGGGGLESGSVASAGFITAIHVAGSVHRRRRSPQRQYSEREWDGVGDD